MWPFPVLDNVNMHVYVVLFIQNCIQVQMRKGCSMLVCKFGQNISDFMLLVAHINWSRNDLELVS